MPWDRLPSVWQDDPMMHVLVSVESFKLGDGCFRRYIGNSRPAVIASSAWPRAAPLRPSSLTTLAVVPLLSTASHQGPHVYCIQYPAIDVVSCNISSSTFLLSSSACLQGHPICPCRVTALLFTLHCSHRGLRAISELPRRPPLLTKHPLSIRGQMMAKIFIILLGLM
jgi:hypothetical protein